MATTDVELCSAALIKLGAAPLVSLADTSAEAAIARHLYPITRDALLASFPWSFTMSQARLTATATAPIGDLAFAFVLPADFLRCISVGTGGRGRGTDYRLIGDRLEADAREILVTYQRRPPEPQFPVHFVAVLVSRLAAEMCLPVTENASRAEVLHRLAAADFQLAKQNDSQQRTPARIEDFTLISARRS